jgi:DNA repair protein RecO (recombination protein O)
VQRIVVEREPAYLLHQRPYRNSSQLLECMTLRHGRVGLVAQGSRRAGTGSRALLQPFVPLRLSWVRRGELGRLVDVEAAAPALALTGTRLMSGYYVNELMLRLLPRDDSNADAFSCYSDCLNALSAAPSVARALRLLEYRLLQALGFGLQLSNDVISNSPIEADKHYTFDFDSGPRAQAGRAGYLGADLISLREERLDQEDALRAARRLLGDALALHLGERQLKSREVLQDIAARGLTM